MAYEYTLPAGILRTGTDDPAQEEGYELQWRDEADPPHYFFWVQASALRLERLMTDALSLLPSRVHAVLEVRGQEPAPDGGAPGPGGGQDEDDDEDDGTDVPPESLAAHRWASPLVQRVSVIRAWQRHAEALTHDGTVGFGAYDPDSPLEVFLDDHKLLSLFSAGLEPFESLLRRHGIPEARGLATILDVDHDHRTLAEIRAGSARARRTWTKKRGSDVAWFAPAIRKSLRMRPQASPPDGSAHDERRADGGSADA